MASGTKPLEELFAEDFLSMLMDIFFKFLHNAEKVSKIFQDARKFYKYFYTGSLIFLSFIRNLPVFY